MRQRTPWLRRFGVLFILVWSLVPLYWAVNTSLQSDAQISSRPAHYLPPSPNLGNYRALLRGTGELPDAISRSTRNILIECGAATVITVVLATLAAYAFARMTFRGRRVVFYAVLATMAFPAYTTLIPIYRSDCSGACRRGGLLLVWGAGGCGCPVLRLPPADRCRWCPSLPPCPRS